jgi:thimet oligopeptidase
MRSFCLSAALFLSAAGYAQPPLAQPPLWASKPDAAAFEKIENTHLDAAQFAIGVLLAAKPPRTLENTLAPFDEATREIDSAQYFASLMEAVHPDAAFRDRASELTRKVSNFAKELSLNRDVYQALAGLKLDGADAATRHYVERQLLQFRRAGVDKDTATRARLRQLNDELTQESSTFDRNIAEATKKVEVLDKSELDGLPQDYIDRHKPGPDGKIYVTTDYPDALPAMRFARNESFRRRLFQAFNSRAYPKNLDVLRQMMKTRYEIASTLGYSSWADYNAADQMIAKGANISQFIADVDRASRPIMQREFSMLLKEKQKTHSGATEINDWEQSYTSEQLRRSEYNFDSQSVRPYFPFQRVKQGVLDTAAKLYHVSFRQEPSAPAWDPSVETWDVIDGDKVIGRFYLDMHPRAGKYSHAAMFPVLDGVRGGQTPEAALVCNFPKPEGEDPGLMEYSDVVTFFHEFGHLTHWILGGRQRWAGISGITMESDFVEAPSQMLEEWMRSPDVLATFARHYKTGEPIPAELVARMNRASAFGRASWTAQQNAYTAISYGIYKDKPEKSDPEQISRTAMTHYTPFKQSEDIHIYSAFGHLSGYSSAYYTYLWDKVIAEDFFGQFDRAHLLTGEAAMRYRRQVLEPGGSMPASELVRGFLGRSQNMTAFQKWMSEEFEKQ